MITGSVLPLLIKMIPYVITMKIVGGIVDVSVHYAKCKIGTGLNKNEIIKNQKLEVVK